MNLDHPSIKMIEIVAKALGELNERVVFVGGSTVALYLEDEGSLEPRPTEDVDCVVELDNYTEFNNFEQKLRKKGFTNSTKPDDPICRWIVDRVTVDIMPTDGGAIGFSNKWYQEGVSQAVKVTLASGTEIKIFSPPYFIASKFEAYLGRGKSDFRTSHDMEDVVTLLDGLVSFQPLFDAPISVKSYLKEQIKIFQKNDIFLESISSHLEPGPVQANRARRIINFLEEFLKS